jgi:hypothetical protein
MTTARSADQTINELLKDINYDHDTFAMELYPFKVRLGAVYRRPPRHPFFEYLLELGHMDIERVFKGESFRGRTHLTFVFPERWVGISEQRSFMYSLNRHPEAKTLELVDIITSCPMFLSDCANVMVRVLQWEDDNEFNFEGP